jgi:hypothetical protein
MLNFGFSGQFDIQNWQESTNAGTSSLWNISNVPNSVILNSYIPWRASSDEMTITAPSDGTVSFAWMAGSSDYENCPVGYVVNNLYTTVNSAGVSSGACQTFQVNQGDTFGFRLGLTSSSNTSFNVTIFNFVFIPNAS